MRLSTLVAVGLLVALGAAAIFAPGVPAGDSSLKAAPAIRTSIAETLDGFHAAAARADEAGYFAHFAPNGVFLGTDPTERWPVEEFRAWAKPHFASGKGWTYHAIERHIDIGPGGEVGWFDEVVHNAKYGDLRGTGVVLLIDGEWKIAQYSLTFQIPNDNAGAVLDIIKHEH